MREYVRDNPDIRKDEYAVDADPVNGSCYVLSEAYFHANGGVDSPFDVYRLGWNDVNDEWEGSHWFLRNGETIVDLSLTTREDGDNVPWEQANRRAFITGYEPSNRCERLLNGLGIEY